MQYPHVLSILCSLVLFSLFFECSFSVFRGIKRKIPPKKQTTLAEKVYVLRMTFVQLEKPIKDSFAGIYLADIDFLRLRTIIFGTFFNGKKYWLFFLSGLSAQSFQSFDYVSSAGLLKLHSACSDMRNLAKVFFWKKIIPNQFSDIEQKLSALLEEKFQHGFWNCILRVRRNNLNIFEMKK